MIQQDQTTSQQAVNPTALRAQIADAQATLAGMQAEYDKVQAQIQKGGGGPAFSSLQVREAQITLDMAHTQGALVRLNELAKLQGIAAGAGTVQPPRIHFYDRFDPDVVLGMSFVVLLAFVIPLSIGLMRRVVRGPARRIGENTLGDGNRLDRLEQAVDSIAIEVERISEGQRFVTKLLADQSAKSPVESGR